MPARVVAFRLEDDLLERLDAHAARMIEAAPGLKVTRTDALRVLLMRTLTEEEAKAGTSAKRRR